eukprot:SAG11_NODE_18524_length_488_cov_1.727506_1_plen_133_part_10
MAVRASNLLHTLAPLAREAPVYAIDYPLAPDQPFPAALLSTLRALAFVKQHSGCAEVDILGDSAGGNLATMAAALLANPPLLAALVAQCGPGKGPGWDTPTASWLRDAWGEDLLRQRRASGKSSTASTACGQP